ncbi:adenylate/guanylate cyclase domain-containing protein [Alphaproteobacteria bacterium]|nr:adenylate/guanylate cyclase domain-containing protein [Alphaproteobacteria bacterium]
MKTNAHRNAVLVLILVVGSLCIGFVASFRIEILVGDLFLVHLRKPLTQPSEVVVVAINEDTLATLPYRSPIDREFLASVITKLDDAKPAIIAVDLLLDRSTESSKDEKLIDVIRTLSTPIVIGRGGRQDRLTDSQLDYQDKALVGVENGLVTLNRDNYDGTIREVYRGREIDEDWHPSFSFAVVQLVTQHLPDTEGRIAYATDEKGDGYSFPIYPAQLIHSLPPSWFAGKIVLLGVDLPDSDRSPTPFVTTDGVERGSLPGVVIHAHLIQQLLDKDVVRNLNPFISLAIGFALALGSILALVTDSRLSYRLLAVACILLGYLTIVALVYRWFDVQLPSVSIVLNVGCVTAIVSLRQWLKDREKKHFVETAFAKYVSPAVVQNIATGRQKLELGGESRMVTYLFTDLQGFTALVEAEDPSEVSKILNSYLDGICELFLEHGATIDKIIGDSVVGFFGAPEEQENQAELAVALSLAIDTFSEDYRQKLLNEGLVLGVTRIGVHKGVAVIGNFGGERFFDYTGHGDCVNTASRLEGANRYFGTRVCVSQSVAQECTSHKFRPIGDVVLKGKTEAIRCLEPFDETSKSRCAPEGFLVGFAALESNQPTALDQFKKLADKFPHDGLVKFQYERLKAGARGVRVVLENK